MPFRDLEAYRAGSDEGSTIARDTGQQHLPNDGFFLVEGRRRRHARSYGNTDPAATTGYPSYFRYSGTVVFGVYPSGVCARTTAATKPATRRTTEENIAAMKRMEKTKNCEKHKD